MKTYYQTMIASGLNLECLGDESLGVQPGDVVLIQCEKYIENCTVVSILQEHIEDVLEFDRLRAEKCKGRRMEGDKTPLILRKATEDDLRVIEENKKLTVDAQQRTRGRIAAHELEMKIVYTHYSFDRKLLLFQFSADGRVDFRELLRDLSTLFRVRVELRQIGVRDEAEILGGIGICGRPFCCRQFLKGFNSINMKMAKQQGIALNPQNISGCCGRLKCCLAFEAEYYRNNPVKKNASAEKEEGKEALEQKDASVPQQSGGKEPVHDKKKADSRGKRGRPEQHQKADSCGEHSADQK